jgi:hypothetical protein
VVVAVAVDITRLVERRVLGVAEGVAHLEAQQAQMGLMALPTQEGVGVVVLILVRQVTAVTAALALSLSKYLTT